MIVWWWFDDDLISAPVGWLVGCVSKVLACQLLQKAPFLACYLQHMAARSYVSSATTILSFMVVLTCSALCHKPPAASWCCFCRGSRPNYHAKSDDPDYEYLLRWSRVHSRLPWLTLTCNNENTKELVPRETSTRLVDQSWLEIGGSEQGLFPSCGSHLQ